MDLAWPIVALVTVILSYLLALELLRRKPVETQDQNLNEIKKEIQKLHDKTSSLSLIVGLKSNHGSS